MDGKGSRTCAPSYRNKTHLIELHASLQHLFVLTRNGIPFDVARQLPASIRQAWVIACGRLEGNALDYHLRRWQEPKA